MSDNKRLQFHAEEVRKERWYNVNQEEKPNSFPIQIIDVGDGNEWAMITPALLAHLLTQEGFRVVA